MADAWQIYTQERTGSESSQRCRTALAAQLPPVPAAVVHPATVICTVVAIESASGLACDDDVDSSCSPIASPETGRKAPSLSTTATWMVRGRLSAPISLTIGRMVSSYPASLSDPPAGVVSLC